MIYLEGILSETARVIGLIFGDLIYIFGLILLIYTISRMFIFIFYLKNKSIITELNINIFDLRLKIIKDFYFTKQGRIVDMLKCINIVSLIYLVFNFNLSIFILIFILNLIGVVYTSTYYNKKLKELLLECNNI